uniref:PHD finger protein 21B n=1 Tax=Neolamprologus brichardi TaxID=32507 RepID=A0A3Q4HXY6_NEOBR
MLGTLTAVPIKVPQVSSLHRLAGQAATVLPQLQVRPKTQIPDSLPHSPCQELQPLSLQRAAAVVSPKSQGPTLPTANSTFSPDHQPNGQSDASPPSAPSGGPDSSSPVHHASAGPGVAYAIIAASPATGNGVSTVSEAVKVIIIQPQAPSSTEGSPAPPTPKSPSTPKSTSPKKDEDPEKIAFMVALGLVTTEHLEIQMKRQERKRRSTANPAYSGLFEPELQRKRLASHYLNSSLFLSARSEDFCWKQDLEHDDHCAVCKEDGELQQCHNCPRAFHPTCLHPPLKTPPRGPWYCPKCQKKVLNKENMSWPQNFVQSYVTHKTRQEEKRRLLRRNNELKKECAHLEEQDKQLNKTLKQCMDLRERLLGQQRDTQASLDRLKTLIRLIQRDQLIQVTMTTTATIATSLLSQSWIKSTSTAAVATPPGPSATPLQTSHSQDDVNI